MDLKNLNKFLRFRIEVISKKGALISAEGKQKLKQVHRRPS